MYLYKSYTNTAHRPVRRAEGRALLSMLEWSHWGLMAFIDSGANVSSAKSDGRQLTYFACDNGCTETAMALIDRGQTLMQG
jgi:hypothetical protein